MLEITPVNLEQANAFVAALTSRSMELTSYTVSDEDERAWCIVCGAEFCPTDDMPIRTTRRDVRRLRVGIGVA